MPGETKRKEPDRHNLKLLPIRAPQEIHDKLKLAAEAHQRRNEAEGRLGRVTVSEVGLEAVKQYLRRLEDEGLIPPAKSAD